MSLTPPQRVELAPTGLFLDPAHKQVTFTGASGLGAVAAAATLSTNLTGNNNDLTFTAVATNATGNDITIAYIDPAAISQSLSVSVSGSAITVNLATDGSGVITSTAALIDAAIDALPAAAALVTPANKAANDGTGIVTAMAATALTGGLTGYASLFTVTGTVAMKLLGICSTDLAGGSATLEVGTPITTAGLIALTTATGIDANEIWHDNSPDASIELTSVLTEKIVSQSVIATTKTAAITGGVIDFYAYWRPLSTDAKVVAV